MASAMMPEPLSPDPESFWRGGEIPVDLFGEVSLPPVDAVLLKRLGTIPLWRGDESLLEALGSLYPKAAQRGMAVFLGDTSTRTEEKIG